MAAELNETVWITLMHEMQSFVRQNLEQPQVQAELRHLIGPQPLGAADIARKTKLT